MNLNRFTPGLETCYVRARVRNPHFIITTPDGTKDGEYSPVFAYAIPAAEVTSISTYIAANSISLSPNLNLGSATGYQYARKAGSKWVTLDTSNSADFTDAGLAANTKYQYRARAYFYNERTGATTWTAWKTVTVYTWGGTLNLEADVASSTSIKLSWSKIAGAEGYEIYRYNYGSIWDVAENGQYFNSFSNHTLIKTITKDSTKTYTDKKLAKGEGYSYYVRAFRTINKQKCYIQDSASASLAAGSMSVKQAYYTSSGSFKVVWQKMTGLKGYKVEKYNPVTQAYEAHSTLKSSATTITFPRVEAGTASATYRVRPYTASKTYTGFTQDVYPQLGVVQGVKAQATSEGIAVSWNAVPGADYYTVYRTTNSHADYDKTTKSYSYPYSGNDYVYEVAVNTDNVNTAVTGTEYNEVGTYYTGEIKTTSVVDRKVTYLTWSYDDKGNLIEVGKTDDGKSIYQTEEVVYPSHYPIEGPEPGVTYYYFVIAHANQPNGQTDVHSISSVGASKAASAAYTKVAVPGKSKISSAKSSKATQATIKYSKVAGAKGYGIYRSTSKNGTYTLVANTTSTSFTDKDLTSGKTYYYKVAPYVVGEAQANVYAELSAYKSVKVK
ncbi:MAG: hypothetical protein GXY32_03615 [Ruminococcaceae bacterium]|nr:hypothetical protein [Oscillospiraceae bacterium]